MAEIAEATVNHRVKFLIENYQRCSQKYFAEKIDVSPSAISSLFSKRGNKPGLEMLQKIAIAYPEIALDWLLIGRGHMLKNDHGGQTKDSLVFEQYTEQVEEILEKIIASQASRRRIDGQTSYATAVSHGIITKELRELSIRIAELGIKAHSLTSGSETVSDEDYNAVNNEYLGLLETQRLKQSELMALRQMEISAIQEAKNTLYRINGEPDISKPFGGLLPHRLGISEAIAQQLVSTGLIRGKLIEGAGYRISEQAVCEYLGESDT